MASLYQIQDHFSTTTIEGYQVSSGHWCDKRRQGYQIQFWKHLEIWGWSLGGGAGSSLGYNATWKLAFLCLSHYYQEIKYICLAATCSNSSPGSVTVYDFCQPQPQKTDKSRLLKQLLWKVFMMNYLLMSLLPSPDNINNPITIFSHAHSSSLLHFQILPQSYNGNIEKKNIPEP